ncbi:Endodeoxyribonuclease RusA [Pseudoalteromonas sp. THAF3]|nr:Endodeoxyribonuclease RusA [Pseudoalteromonas sp. THAF3]
MGDPKKWVSTGLKPLSANKMHLGRKVDSAEYRRYKKHLVDTLPDLDIPDGPLRVRLLVCFSSKLADLDNVFKPFLDTLQARYGFNDRHVHRIVAQKKIVPKGKETILFSVDAWEPTPEELQEIQNAQTPDYCPECGQPQGATA